MIDLAWASRRIDACRCVECLPFSSSLIDSFFAEGSRATRTSKWGQLVDGLVARDQLFSPQPAWVQLPDVCEIPAAAWCTVVASEVTP